MASFKQIASKIIEEQELIIGPLAWTEAEKVAGLKVVDEKKGEIELGDDEMGVVDALVGRYERLFGRASREACREAVAGMLAELQPAQIPTSLR